MSSHVRSSSRLTAASDLGCAVPIERVHLDVVRQPLLRPFGISSGSVTHIESVIVSMESSGTVGFGETVSMPPYTGRTLAGLLDVLETILIPAVIGHDARDVIGFHTVMNQAIRGQEEAKAALDIATHDLLGRVLRTPVSALLGATTRAVPSAWVVGLDADNDGVIAEAREATHNGYLHVKIKGGANPARDVRVAEALVDAMPEGVSTSVDFNGGYDLQTALRTLPKLVQIGIDWFEQPLPEWDLDGSRRLHARGLPVLLDESAKSVHDVAYIVKNEAAAAVNIKVLKFGGLYPARIAMDIATLGGLTVKFGTMPELGIATRAAAHLSATCQARQVPGDFVGSLMVSDDPFKGNAFAGDGYVQLRDEAGLGSW